MSDQHHPNGLDSLFEHGLAEENLRTYYPDRKGQGWLTIIALVGLAVAIAIPRIRPPDRTGGHVNSCIANLRQLDSAKEQWAMDNKKPYGAIVQFSDLVGTRLYLRSLPSCPNGGVYSVNVIGKNPTCTVEWHCLPDSSQ